MAQAQINTLEANQEFQVNGVSKTTIGNDGNIMVTGTPTAGQHLTTKTYVDAAVASAGSGGATYMGLTSVAYTGNISYGGYTGIRAADAACDADYLDSHFMRTSEIESVASQITSVTNGRVSCDKTYIYSTTYKCFFGTLGFGGFYPNCQGWKTTNSSYFGMGYNGTGAAMSINCVTAIKLHCVK